MNISKRDLESSYWIEIKIVVEKLKHKIQNVHSTF